MNSNEHFEEINNRQQAAEILNSPELFIAQVLITKMLVQDYRVAKPGNIAVLKLLKINQTLMGIFHPLEIAHYKCNIYKINKREFGIMKFF